MDVIIMTKLTETEYLGFQLIESSSETVVAANKFEVFFILQIKVKRG
jgi:hypothetical protein